MTATEWFMKAEIEKLEKENKELKDDNKLLIETNERLKERNRELFDENKKLKEKLWELAKMYNEKNDECIELYDRLDKLRTDNIYEEWLYD